ncbi:MAG TPA: substrate-binding domain-containing protein [Candidatus Didemnitutus sp.]|nr:substrate-binding domain-containing protein [Candidatus Didemnitutus sp.]
MPNRILRYLIGALILSCASLSSFAAGPKIGVLLKGRANFWQVIDQTATAAGTKAGAEVIVKAPMSESDVAVQIQMLNALAAAGAQAIIIAPTNKDALAEPVAALAAKGIKIIVIDSPLAGTAASTFIGTDHHAAGEAAGKLVASLIGDSDEITVIRHAQNNGATMARESGALEQIKAAHPKAVVHADIYASTENGVEAERAQLALTRYPQSKAIIASGTPGTMAMCELLAKGGGNGVKFVGFGVNLNPTVASALEAGTMHGWVAQLPVEIGHKSIEAALALINGQTVPPVIHTDFVVVTKANLHDPKVQELLKL